MIDETAAILQKLERNLAEIVLTIAKLRERAAPPIGDSTALIDDWIETVAAARIAGVSKSRMNTLCRDNRIGSSANGFSRKLSGRWQVSLSRLRIWVGTR